MKERKNYVWNDKEEKLTKILSGILLVFEVIAIAALILLGCASCKSTAVTATERVVDRDTLTVFQAQRDSIFVHDSVFHEIVSRGDTVYVTNDRWHTAYRDRILHDSIYIHNTDTIYKDVVKTVEKKETFFQKARRKIGGFVIITAILVGCIFVVRWVFMKYMDK